MFFPLTPEFRYPEFHHNWNRQYVCTVGRSFGILKFSPRLLINVYDLDSEVSDQMLMKVNTLCFDRHILKAVNFPQAVCKASNTNDMLLTVGNIKWVGMWPALEPNMEIHDAGRALYNAKRSYIPNHMLRIPVAPSVFQRQFTHWFFDCQLNLPHGWLLVKWRSIVDFNYDIIIDLGKL